MRNEDKLILCMKWGTRYSADYANRLYRMVERHISGPFHFVCFTDDAAGLDAAIDARPLPPFPGVPSHLVNLPWKKLSLWQRDLAPDLNGRDALVLDLDLVITGGLDDFFDFCPGRYVVIENPTKRGRNIGNTSVFRFTVGAYPHIYDQFIANPEDIYRNRFRIEQEFISHVLHTEEQQFFWPRPWVVSFKKDLLPIWPLRLFRAAPLPSSARIVIFHGKPDPHEARNGSWPSANPFKRVYKVLRPVRWIETNWN